VCRVGGGYTVFQEWLPENDLEFQRQLVKSMIKS
jgi:hypothetical protein